MNYAQIKSLIDRVMALSFILLLFPVFTVVFLLLFFHFNSSPIFTQLRPGYKGKLFRIYKFKTMWDNTDLNSSNDQFRITKLGGVIRKLSIDELPQLFNVFLGQMSFVGPRPLLESYLKIYTKEENRRHDVLPGITGWAQINGRNSISWKNKFLLDLWYVKNQSFLVDLKILLLTVLKVFKSEGVNSTPQKTMDLYNGKN